MIKTYTFESKILDEVESTIKRKFNFNSDEIFYKVEEEQLGLFKGKHYKIYLVLKEDVYNEIREYLEKITDLMGTNIKLEIQKRKEYVKFNIHSDNNKILIGKNGRNLDALQLILKQYIKNQIGINVNLIIDIENYRTKQEKKLEHIINNLCKEIIDTNITVELEPMNSYKRLLVHNIISKYKELSSTSTGENENRHIIISKKD